MTFYNLLTGVLAGVLALVSLLLLVAATERGARARSAFLRALCASAFIWRGAS